MDRDPTHQFKDTLVAEGSDAYVKQNRVTVDEKIDTVLFVAQTADRTDPIIARMTHLDTTSEGVLFRLETFRGEDKLTEDDFSLNSEPLRFEAIKHPNFEGRDVSEETLALFEARTITAEPIFVARKAQNRKLGVGEAQFDVNDPEVDGASITHKSGRRLFFFNRKGKKEDGDHLEGQDVKEVQITEPDGTKTKIVDLAEHFETEVRAGGRFVMRHRAASALGSAAIVSAGAVALAIKMGKSRFGSR